MDCPACGTQGLSVGGHCPRCGLPTPVVSGPPGFMPPQKLELTGLQMASVFLVTFLTTVATIAFHLVVGVLDLVFRATSGWWLLIIVPLLFILPGTLAGVLLYQRFLAKNLTKLASAQSKL